MSSRYEELGRRLRMAREAAGFSQGKLGAKLGAAGSTITNYEKAKRRVPIEDLERLAEILGRPPSWFLGYEDISPQRDAAARLVSIERQLEGVKSLLVEQGQQVRERGEIYGEVPSEVAEARNREEMIDRAFERVSRSGFPTRLRCGLSYADKLELIRWYEKITGERLAPGDLE